MKRILYYVLLAPIVFAVTAALIASCNVKKTSAKSLNGSWTITSVDSKAIDMEEMPFIEFDMETKRVHGNGSCNTFNSSVTLSETNVSDLTIAPAAATMMACMDMAVEGQIFKALDKVASVKAGTNASEMLLLSAEGKELMKLKKK
jgi:heat shock protein HslJ